MPRKKRSSRDKAPLSQFLHRLLKEKNLTLKAAAEIAGTATSTVQSWRDGAAPSETVSCFKKLCNIYGYTLSYALTGESDDIDGDLSHHFSEDEWFDGYARIKILKLVPKKNKKKA